MAHAQKPGLVFRAKRTNPFKSEGASVQSTTGSRGMRISGSNAGYTMLRGSVKSTGYPLHSPVSPSLPFPCVIVCHHISTGLYLHCGLIPFVQRTDSTVNQGRPSQKRQSSCHALRQFGTQSGQSNSLQLPHDGCVMTYWALVHIAPLCQPHRFRRSVKGLKFPRTCSYGLASISLKHGTSRHIGQLIQIGSLFWGFTSHGQVAVVMFGSPEGPEVDYRTSRPSWIPYLPLGKFMDSGGTFS